MSKPVTFGTPTGTAWKTDSEQLVQIYRRGTGGWIWGCGGCLAKGPEALSADAPHLFRAAQDHAKGCSAIQV